MTSVATSRFPAASKTRPAWPGSGISTSGTRSMVPAFSIASDAAQTRDRRRVETLAGLELDLARQREPVWAEQVEPRGLVARPDRLDVATDLTQGRDRQRQVACVRRGDAPLAVNLGLAIEPPAEPSGMAEDRLEGGPRTIATIAVSAGHDG